MAFSDAPQADQYSINSEESQLKLRGVLKQKTGFVCREEVPDKGCDYDVELLVNGGDVSNWRFAIQLKSVEGITLIDKDKFISYTFPTSRLGYLIRRQPTKGMIVLYDVLTDRIFYDYADKIYLRIMNERGSDDWKSNDMVNIHIPVENELDEKEAIKIHSLFKKQFENAQLMQSSFGSKYGLPDMSAVQQTDYDFNNIEHIKEILKKHGLGWLYEQNLELIYDLIIKIPNQELYADRDLLIVACLAYAEAGKYIDARFFSDRLRKRYTLNEQESQMIRFIDLKIDLWFGEIDFGVFVAELEKLLVVVTGDVNKVVLKQNILYYKLTTFKGLQTIPQSVLSEIQALVGEIENLKCSDRLKCLFKIWNLGNHAQCISHLRNEDFIALRMRESLGAPLTVDERKKTALAMIDMHRGFYTILDDLQKTAQSLDDELLIAYLHSAHCYFQLSFEIQMIAYETPVDHRDATKRDTLLKDINRALNAANLYQKLNHLKQAYSNLCLAIEFVYLFKDRYLFEANIDLEGLLNLKHQAEIEFDYNKQELAIPGLLDKKRQMSDDEGGRDSMLRVAKLSDDQIRNLANVVINSGKYPLAKAEFIYQEAKSYQLFYSRCSDLNIELLEHHHPNPLFMYARPVIFFLRNRSTGIDSLPNEDVAKLLTSWGF